MASKAKLKTLKADTLKTPKTSVVLKDEDKSGLVFTVLSAAKTQKIFEATDVDQLERVVAEFLKLHDVTYNLNEYIRLDYYVAGLWWCREQNYSAEQTSAFYAIMDIQIKNFLKQNTLSDSVLELKQMLISIYPEGSDGYGSCLMGIFNTDQVQDILEYFRTSLFQHHKLYDCFFQGPSLDFIIGTDLLTEVPKPASLPWPCPLTEGISEEVSKLASHKDEPPEESADAAEQQKESDEQPTSAATDGYMRFLEQTLMAQLTPEEIIKIIESVYAEMLVGLEDEIAAKIKEKENVLLSKINQAYGTGRSSRTQPSLVR